MHQDLSQEPSPRYNHILGSVGNRSYVLVGQTEKFDEENEREQLANVVHAFDHTTREWVPPGEIAGHSRPPSLRSGGFVSYNSDIYSFGGRNDTNGNRHNSLHKFDTNSLSWTVLPSFNPQPPEAPMPKSGCELVVIDGKLCVFGGYGTPTSQVDSLQPYSEYHREEGLYDKGHTNEFHFYSLQKGDQESAVI